MDKSSLLNTVEARFQAFEQSLNGERQSDWHSLRSDSLQKLVETGFPSAKTEDYRYTPIARDLRNILDLDAREESQPKVDLAKFSNGGREGINIYVIDGQLIDFTPVRSEALVIDNLKLSFSQADDNLENHYNKLVEKYEDSFSLMNSAFSDNGLYIKISDNAEINDKISIINIQTGSGAEAYNQQRTLIQVGRSASAEISEFYYTANNSDNFLNQLTEIYLDENAQLEFNRIGLEQANAVHIGNTFVDQKRSSRFNASTFTFGGKRIRNNLNISLDGEGIETHMNGLYLLTGDTHADHHTIVDHMKPHSESNELYKGIMDDQSTGVFNGKIYVRQDAQKTNAFQSNNNILLSDEASINAKPQLEIWADDVKCSHGCTTGQLDEESVFYLRSRGLNEKTATGVLLHAFAGEVLEKVKDESLREFLDKKVIELLHSEW